MGGDYVVISVLLCFLCITFHLTFVESIDVDVNLQTNEKVTNILLLDFDIYNFLSIALCIIPLMYLLCHLILIITIGVNIHNYFMLLICSTKI